MELGINPWQRANLEQFNPETLALHPEGLRPEYTRIMKELAHAKAIAALALERVYMFEQQREVHFEPFLDPDYSSVTVIHTPDNNTKAPEGAVCAPSRTPAEADTPDYTPVTDLNEYRERHV